MPRYAKKTTIDDLKNYVHNKYLKLAVEDFDLDETEEPQHVLFYTWLKAVQSVPEGDYKVKFDFENFSDPEHAFEPFGEFEGFYQLNDFAIGLCFAGGDWECPLYFAIYIDDKNKLRAYIPTVGNVFNYYTKAAFGSDLYTDNDNKMPDNFLYEKHPEFDVSEFDGDHYHGEDAKYTLEYDRWRESLNPEFENVGEYDIDNMLEDIESRICVKGNENSLKPKPKNTRTYEEFLKNNPIDSEYYKDDNEDECIEQELPKPIEGLPFEAAIEKEVEKCIKEKEALIRNSASKEQLQKFYEDSKNDKTVYSDFKLDIDCKYIEIIPKGSYAIINGKHIYYDGVTIIKHNKFDTILDN